jgi:hypothetical protein
MGEATGVHPSLSPPWDGELASALELLQWVNNISKGHLDAAAGGAFLSLTINEATTLIEKMVTNQSWGEDRTPAKTQKGMHTVKEAYMLAAKIDLLLMRFDERAVDINIGTVKALDSQMTYEVCGNVGHSSNDCSETHEDSTYINNGFHQQGGGNNGWSKPTSTTMPR